MANGTRTVAPPRLALGVAYVANFGALAASGPFLALHLGVAGFSPAMTAQLLALLLLVRVIAVPAWTVLADRVGAIGFVLRLVSTGALFSFAGLLFGPRPALVAVALLFFAAFRAPLGPLLDALALRDVEETARSFGAVRAWGTAGYACAAMATGALVAREGSHGVLYATTGLLGAALASALFIGGNSPPLPHVSRSGGRLLVSLLGRPRVLALFAIALLQEIGLAPYDALFPAYLTRLGGATVAGVAVAVGAGAEFLFLLGGMSLVRRLGPERLLAVACVASVVRWTAIALVTSATALVGIQALHALSFGAFYLASVFLIDRETPPSLRASGQGIFGSFTFGIAAALGLSIAGVVERRGGMPAVFSLAAGASLAATAGAFLLTSRGAKSPDAV